MICIFDTSSRRCRAFITAVLAIASLTGGSLSSAQVSSDPSRFSSQAEGYLERARIMLDAGNYAGVIDQLKILQTRNTDLSLLSCLTPAAREEYIYMLAEALYQRGDEECVTMLRNFIREFPASPLALQARLSIADFYFFKHDWQQALESYDEVDFDRLNRTQLPLYSYRKALTLIKTGSYDSALPLLRRIASIQEYKNAARFYQAYIDFEKGDYEEAYSGFSGVKGAVDGLRPEYYLAQIDFLRKNYRKVIGQASVLTGKDCVEELMPETNRILGLSYFKEGDYRNARKYLSAYIKSIPETAAPDAVYSLGVADYEEGEYSDAAERFRTLTSLNSELGQSAWLYLGQCDLKTGNTDAAAMAFEKAAALNYDPKVTETAVYNYAAALTRGGKIPFSSSSMLMEKFIRDYPDSEYVPKVEEYLATAYYNDRNYAKALNSINAISRPSAKVLAAKQKILYELGMECVSNGNYKDGADYLRQSIALASHDRAIAAQAQLWLGDALYTRADFKGAKAAYTAAAKQIPPSANRSLALYNLAYTDYMLDNYKVAAQEFADALAALPSLPGSLINDATIRRADCLYYTGNYAAAKNLYAQAVSDNAADADYAFYRHAVMMGLDNDTKGKIRNLSEMHSRYPQSRWLPAAMLEKALTYESLGQTDNANSTFRDLSQKYPDATQARRALLNLAISDMKKGMTAEAEDEYKDIIRRWPSSEEASLANEDLKKYYASTGQLREYQLFLSSVKGATQLNADEMEQLTFDGAEIAYSENSNNISLLENYVKEYPSGKYIAQAMLDIAYSLKKQKKYEQAEQYLSRLIAERPHAPQTPEALLMKAEILEYNLDRNKDALLAYRQLEKLSPDDFGPDAAAGIMRTTTDLNEKLIYARKTRLSGGLSAELTEEASLIEAETLLKLNRGAEAVEILSRLAESPSSEPGAKAAVVLARYYLDTRQYKAAERTALAFTDAGTPHEFQLAQGYIALADAYHAQGQTGIAKEYLQALKQNYPGKEPEIFNAISSRLNTWK